MKRRLLIILVSFVGFSALFGQDSTAVQLWEEEFLFIDEARLDSGGVFTFWGLYFHLGSAELIDSATNSNKGVINTDFMHPNEVRLSAVTDYLFRHPNYIVEVGVHTDCRGSAWRSIHLSMARAKAIVNELVKRGVNRDRLIPNGFEDRVPYVDNGIELTCDYIMRHPKMEGVDMHQKNRRFQLRILSKKYVSATVSNKLDAAETFISYKFRFNYLTSTLIDSVNEDLIELADYMIENPLVRIEIGVHSDCRAKISSRNLSQIRANAIKEQLVALEISPNRISAVGYHGAMPLEQNGIVYTCDYIQNQPQEDAQFLYQRSRRVEFKLSY